MSALGLILVSVWGGGVALHHRRRLQALICFWANTWRGVALRHLHRLQALEVQCLL
jgi:hypothetical protein